MKRIIEICANSAQSCVEAEAGGATRVELCAGIPEGGTTPSYGEIKTAKALTSKIDINVIIRPRGGDFLYTEAEVQSMLLDIELCKELKVHGVVFGCLTKDGDIDVPLMPGCGVRENNIGKIEAETGAKEFHTSARSIVYSKMEYRNENVPMGSSIVSSEFETVQTDREKVKAYI